MRAAIRLSSFLLLFTCSVTGAFEASLFEAGTHCVAYRVQSTMFFVKSNSVIGRNCDVSAQVLPEVGGLYHIEVNIPIRSFNSGDTERDRDVAKILKVEKRPELTFKSLSHSGEKWREFFSKPEFDLEGRLFIGDKSFPVQFSSRYMDKEDAGEIDGVGRVKFVDFDLKPPKVAGGVFASVKPELELHFHFVSQRILGADSIRPVKKGE
jgi:hypothetical protein